MVVQVKCHVALPLHMVTSSLPIIQAPYYNQENNPCLQHAPELCTVNLHTLLCRLPVQLRECGSDVGERNEMWGERMMQEGKGRHREAYPRHPEFTIAKRIYSQAHLRSK